MAKDFNTRNRALQHGAAHAIQEKTKTPTKKADLSKKKISLFTLGAGILQTIPN
ncbi:hypothetical protein [Comamonas aquatica]|uniref:hypothetical protein n=1 Tax=Comamonas aquatica TaxID=225991 RepID=UPI0034D5FE55